MNRPEAVCGNVRLDVAPGDTVRLETEATTTGLRSGEVPHVRYQVGDLGGAQADVVLTD
ncbi:hypothetical protein V1J52_10595 [Streptomyces sp. TRM 70351]|uniref:hypothetical protein n=1 Tax=Streptomyces sp. TRM 70351 TaxID=3116552 RepID=UPI002E7B06CD|nr:hypothetical protein [Streptomyces sp. TRM 70351]MEE1928637.1 hypothetical protein [Streptomyces sp. TRM 70351]